MRGIEFGVSSNFLEIPFIWQNEWFELCESKIVWLFLVCASNRIVDWFMRWEYTGPSSLLWVYFLLLGLVYYLAEAILQLEYGINNSNNVHRAFSGINTHFEWSCQMHELTHTQIPNASKHILFLPSNWHSNGIAIRCVNVSHLFRSRTLEFLLCCSLTVVIYLLFSSHILLLFIFHKCLMRSNKWNEKHFVKATE